jgi:cob(I)alamin adenosyltransferase
MSISTKRGDGGQTELMFGRRVSKADQRVAANGAVDELNAALGLVRVADCSPMVSGEMVPSLQADLIVLMGELATDLADLPRYIESGFTQISAGMVDRLGAEVDRIERDFVIKFKGWALPGDSGSSGAAHLDMARTICRRAEREVVVLAIENAEVVRFLNRLSDLLWLMARVESMPET